MSSLNVYGRKTETLVFRMNEIYINMRGDSGCCWRMKTLRGIAYEPLVQSK